MKQVSEEVYYANQNLVQVDYQKIKILKEKSIDTHRKRNRLCVHKDVDDLLHEMLIIHAKDAYVKPHKHLKKSESFHLIEGEVNVIIFEEDGQVKDVIQMGDYLSGKVFYYRISDSLYHTLVITSDILVFHETTRGPFDREDTIFAPWSPVENDVVGMALFQERLNQEIQRFL